MKTHRGDFSSVVLNDMVHVYGGYTPPQFCVPLTSHDVYDPVADAWTVSTPLPDNLAEKDDGVVINGLLLSIGGEKKAVTVGCVDQDIIPLKEVFAFDPVTASWKNETSLPDDRMRFASAAIGSTVFIFGGQGRIVDGDMLPVLYSAYALSAGDSPGGGGSSGALYTRGDMAGAVVGTFLASILLAVLFVLVRRRALSASHTIAGGAAAKSAATATNARRLSESSDVGRVTLHVRA